MAFALSEGERVRREFERNPGTGRFLFRYPSANTLIVRMVPRTEYVTRESCCFAEQSRAFPKQSVFGTSNPSDSSRIVSISYGGPGRGVFGTWVTCIYWSAKSAITPSRRGIACGLPTIRQSQLKNWANSARTGFFLRNCLTSNRGRQSFHRCSGVPATRTLHHLRSYRRSGDFPTSLELLRWRATDRAECPLEVGQ